MDFDEYIEKRSLTFWDKVDVMENDSCWNWGGYKDPSGYGRTSFRGKPITAHRVAWMLENKQEIPKDKMIIHSCISYQCVNPKHLFLGDYQAMMDNNFSKGVRTRRVDLHISTPEDRRQRWTEKVKNSPPLRQGYNKEKTSLNMKLSEEDALDLCRKYFSGKIDEKTSASYRNLGDHYGVSRTTVGKIIDKYKDRM